MANRRWSYHDTTVTLFCFITCSNHRKGNKSPQGQNIKTRAALRSQEDIPFAISKCEVIPGPFSNLLRRTLMNNHLSREEKFIDIQAAGRQETKALEKGFLALEIVTAVA